MATPAADRPPATRDRLIEAAGAVFAARGYRGATMREIAERAGANLAAAHYHFGSKLDLYRAVVSAHFEQLEARLAAGGGAAPSQASAPPPRARVIEQLRARIRTMLATLLEPEGVHPRLMLREFSDPSELLPFVVERFLTPLQRDSMRLLALLAPSLDEAALRRAMWSVVGQASVYLTHRAAVLSTMKRRRYPPDFIDAIADHVVTFTVGGLAALEKEHGRSRRVARGAR